MRELKKDAWEIAALVATLESETTAESREEARAVVGSRMDQAIDQIAQANQIYEKKPAKAAEALRRSAAEALAAARILDAL